MLPLHGDVRKPATTTSTTQNIQTLSLEYTVCNDHCLPLSLYILRTETWSKVICYVLKSGNSVVKGYISIQIKIQIKRIIQSTLTKPKFTYLSCINLILKKSILYDPPPEIIILYLNLWHLSLTFEHILWQFYSWVLSLKSIITLWGFLHEWPNQ